MTPSDYLPAFLRARLTGRDTVRRALDNSFWLFCEQLLRMGFGLVVGVWVARYLEPGAFGVLSYALALVAVVGACVSLGINTVVVREVARLPEKTATFLGTAFALKVAGATVGLGLCAILAWVRPMPDPHARWVVLAAATGLLFQTFDVFDLLFQAEGVARFSAWVRMGACVLANALKVAFILGHASVVCFGVGFAIEALLTAAGWWWAARARGWRFARFHFDRAASAALLRESWPLALTGISVQVQASADQVMLGNLLGGSQLGQYAVAMRLVTLFGFLPMVIYTVSAPEITRAKRDDEQLYQRRLYGLYRLMSGLFWVTALPLMLFGPMAVRLLYGSAYEGAAVLLPLMALRLFFTNFGVAHSIFITNESLFRFALSTALAGAGVNLALNYLLIPHWGARGAIIAFIGSFTVMTFLLDVLQPKARRNLRLMILAAVMPWRRYAG